MENIMILLSIITASWIFISLRRLIIKRGIKTMKENPIVREKLKQIKELHTKGLISQKAFAEETANLIRGNKNQSNVSIGKVYRKDGQEVFQWQKFFTGFRGLFNPVGWAKDFIGLFNVRKLVIYVIILASIFSYGLYKGQQGQPIKIDIGYGKEARIKVDGHYLHIQKNGDVWVEDNKGNKIKQVAVKDIEGLAKKLAPIGFELVPIGVLGGGFGKDGVEGEIGAGVSWLRYWKWRMESFLTTKGIYPLGTSYKLTQNSGLGAGVGKGYKGDNRIIFYYKWEF